MRLLAVLLLLVPVLCAADFRSEWPANIERIWIGPAYWANPLQDWRIAGGRLECVVSGANRNVNLLTRQLSDNSGDVKMSVRLGHLEAGEAKLDPGWAGFRIGIQGLIKDYRYRAIRGTGLNAGITTTGQPFVGEEQARAAFKRRATSVPLDNVELRLSVTPAGDKYEVILSVHDAGSGEKFREAGRRDISPEQVAGNIALVSDHTPEMEPSSQNSYRAQGSRRGGNVRFWFSDWQVSGSKVEAHPEQTFGPILFAQHTLGKSVMKMTAQMPPLGASDNTTVRLQIKEPGGNEWKTIDEEHIHALARTATFRIPDWDSSRDVPYRLAYALIGPDGKAKVHYWSGTVRRDPVDKETIVVAAFTGNKDTGFPNAPTVRNVRYHDPDVLFFSGDQIYEDVAGYGKQRAPVETATLDYLRKWWLVGWAFGDLMRDRVTVSMPDDHDVYQGNIWGGGGRKQPMSEHERGGYVMPAEWVNAVERTQTSHLPDPYDPRPVEQGIGVYYSELNYGRISFGIIEDRKFKSGPKGIVPPTGGRPDHITDPNFDRDAYDPPGAKLLGDRQIAFIRDWTSDWGNADMKVSLTQTIFAAAATTHGGGFMRLVADLDTNGWPRSARNRALRELRRGYVFMIGGDQHLPSIIHHGIDEFNDSGWSFCVPSIAAGYPRLYEPDEPGENRLPGMPGYTGEHFDSFGNRMTVWAVANPKKKWRQHPLEMLQDKASGYGIVRLNKKTGEITIECWPILSDPSKPGAGAQFTGWPKTIRLEDNYSRKPAAWLPRLDITGMRNPAVQVINEDTGEIVYTLRISGASWRPKVFEKAAAYTVKVGEPGTDEMQTFSGLTPEF